MTQDSDKYTPPSRQGKTLIGGHFDPEVKRKLKIIAAQEDSSIQALLEEAITKLIKDRNA
jgi:predicted HicB family RNase H-like nuclease